MLLQRNLRRICLSHRCSSHLSQAARNASSISEPEARKGQNSKTPSQSKPKKRNSKSIRDRMISTPSFRLNFLLKDIAPSTVGRNDRFHVSKPTHHRHYLSLYDHLAYWLLQDAPSELAPDGADLDHVPWDQTVAGPNEPAAQGLRLWESGSITYKRNWRLDFVFDGKTRLCRESTHSAPGNESAPRTDILRNYQHVKEPWSNEVGLKEQRRLIFINGALAERVLRESPEVQPKEDYIPTADHIHQFTTTPAQLFQFSALTFNSHYIHLDPKKGLVHGSLLYALMLRAVEQHVEIQSQSNKFVRKFEYTCKKPLKVGEMAWICLSKGSYVGEVEKIEESVMPAEEKAGDHAETGVEAATVQQPAEEKQQEQQGTGEEAPGVEQVAEATNTKDVWRVWIERSDGRLIAEGSVTAEEGVQPIEDEPLHEQSGEQGLPPVWDPVDNKLKRQTHPAGNVTIVDPSKLSFKAGQIIISMALETLRAMKDKYSKVNIEAELRTKAENLEKASGDARLAATLKGGLLAILERGDKEMLARCMKGGGEGEVIQRLHLMALKEEAARKKDGEE